MSAYILENWPLLCRKRLIFISWWWNNKFLREYLRNIDCKKEHINTINNFKLINIDLKDEINIEWKQELLNKTNMSLLSMIIATKEIVNVRNDPIIDILKSVISKIRD